MNVRVSPSLTRMLHSHHPPPSTITPQSCCTSVVPRRMPLATVDLKSAGTHNAHWTDWSKARLKRLWSFSKAWVLSAQTSPALFFPESTIPFLPGPEIIKYLIPYKSAFLCLHCSYIPINWGFFKGRIAYFYTSTTSQRLAHRKCTTTFTDE